MMKNPKIILSCLISIMFATAASAAWVPLTDEVPLSSLQGSSLPFGDKEVSEFALRCLPPGGGALPPNPDTMTVQGGQNSITGDYGLKFNFPWIAISNQTINATLSFKVSMSILPRFDDCFIKDVTLVITGVSTNGTGVVSIGEEVWDVPFYTPGSFPIAALNCSKWKGSPLDYLVDHAEFAQPVKEIWIYKDVSITGGTNGLAHLSEFFQFYSQTQVPEPATIVLLGTAGICVFTRKKRSA